MMKKIFFGICVFVLLGMLVVPTMSTPIITTDETEIELESEPIEEKDPGDSSIIYSFIVGEADEVVRDDFTFEVHEGMSRGIRIWGMYREHDPPARWSFDHYLTPATGSIHVPIEAFKFIPTRYVILGGYFKFRGIIIGDFLYSK